MTQASTMPSMQSLVNSDWYTDEPAPRKIIIKGSSGIDPDCIVAHLEDDPETFWIVVQTDPEKFPVTRHNFKAVPYPIRNRPMLHGDLYA